ncbi:MAG: LamG domain-containing protein [Bacteroidetes bacterium SB0662_bin_6]|nr:LamG domain-containing protein [Bacteroidetes bacterium SB0668_bin_1]MYE03382.1 LamG domain-containing protein [Bacteroidetes bacterium SB0662_bin_6]
MATEGPWKPDSRFTFALASTGADQDGDGVYDLHGRPTPVESGGWYHVTGTYDGSVMSSLPPQQI